MYFDDVGIFRLSRSKFPSNLEDDVTAIVTISDSRPVRRKTDSGMFATFYGETIQRNRRSFVGRP